MKQAFRVAAIDRCMSELDRLRHSRGLPDLSDRWGVTIGELDWLEELHRLLYLTGDMF